MSTGTSDPWSMPVSSGDGNFELCPAGSATATIVGIYDVGSHPTQNDKGESYNRREMVLVFELVKKRAKDGVPFILAAQYTWSMRDTSKFYALASNLTGVKFAEGDTFDPRKLLGMTVSVSVVHSQSKPNDKGKVATFANIGNVQQWATEDDEGNPKKRPTPTHTPIAWSLSTGEPLPDVSWVPKVFGDTLATMIECSTEWKGGTVPHSILGTRSNGAQTAPAAARGRER